MLSNKYLTENSDLGLEQQKTLFNSYTPVDEASTSKYGGLELDLSICRLLVNLMVGEVGFFNKEGKESCF